MARPEVAGQVRSGRWTISRLMIAVALFALVCAASRPGSFDAPYARGAALGVALCASAAAIALGFGPQRCPRCRESKLIFVQARPFRGAYYRCRHCGHRARLSGLGRYSDASGPECDRVFDKAKPVATWREGPILPDATSPEARTVAALLREKLDRNAKPDDTSDPQAAPSG